MLRDMRAAVYGRQSKGKTKSIDDQIDIGVELVTSSGWKAAGVYSDATSASRYGKRARGGWAEVRQAAIGKRFDVLVLWESSRGDRTAETWLGFLRECRVAGVRIHVVSHERTYDLAVARDWKALAEDGVANEYESEQISARAKRGLAQAAKAGAPPNGPAPYGYERRYDAATGKGVLVPDKRQAAVVREIITRLSHSEPTRAIIRDLEARGIAGPAGGAWHRQRIRRMALSPVYVGMRRHLGTVHPGTWPALVDLDVWHAARRVLTTDERSLAGSHIRPGRQVHLLSFYATCAQCGGPLRASRTGYRCEASCVLVTRRLLDDLVSELTRARLADPEVYTALTHADQAADVAATAARAELAEVAAQLDMWRASAVKGETSPGSLAAIESGLLTRQRIATAALRAATVPAALADYIGARTDVDSRWAAAPVQGRRAVLRALGLAVAVRPTGGRTRPIHERVDIAWGDPVS